MAKYPITKRSYSRTFNKELRLRMFQLHAHPVVALQRLIINPDQIVSVILKPTKTVKNSPINSNKIPKRSLKEYLKDFIDDEAFETSSVSTYTSSINSLTDNIRRLDNRLDNDSSSDTSYYDEPIVHYK